jgi:hypothetical protein
MSPIGTPVPGAFPLTSADKLPNVTIAYPGERWSDRKASGQIIPGVAVVPIASAGKLLMRPAVGGDAATQMAVATRTIDVPDQSAGSWYNEPLGPNEIRNLPIKDGDYVLALYSGALILTLIQAHAYQPSELIGWNPAANAQGGKPQGIGAWAPMGAGVIGPLFEVQMFRPVNPAGDQGILNVRSLRGQGPF